MLARITTPTSGRAEIFGRLGSLLEVGTGFNAETLRPIPLPSDGPTTGEGEHYNSSAILVEDYDYWIRVWKQFRMQRLVEPLYYYRRHRQSLTFKHGPQEVAVRFNAVKQQNGIA